MCCARPWPLRPEPCRRRPGCDHLIQPRRVQRRPDPNDRRVQRRPDPGCGGRRSASTIGPRDTGRVTSTFNLADLFESVVDTVADRPAMITPARRLTFAEIDERANRLANHLAAQGVGAGDHVSLLLLNGTEYMEAMLAAFKLRAVPINVNYRYVERELEYLFDNSDSVAVIAHRRFAPRLTEVVPRCPGIRHVLLVDDDSGADYRAGDDMADAADYETALAAASPERPDGAERSGDDIYIAYTGGTTGMPKGVVWRHEDIFFAALGGGDPTQMEGPIASPDELPGRIPEGQGVQLQTPPLMHVSAHWGTLQTFFGGGTAVLLSPGGFDADEALDTIEREGVMICILVGDAMARPLADAIAANTAADGAQRDLSSLFVIGSGGAMLTAAVKESLREHLPDLIIVDGYGSSETGVAGSQTTMGDGEAGGSRFAMGADTLVLDDDNRPVEPGSGVIGRLARRGHVPLGYYRDEEKSKATFVELDGARWVLPGDMATPEADGTITLVGRGSVSINTGGEKVFPEEVEAVLKAHPAIYDAVVVGVPDERWGNRVVAVSSLRAGAALELEPLREYCRDHLAGYKVPRELVVVDQVERNPNGKPDYGWATEQAGTIRP
ncbi:MAG: acyl-CoA synthetase [Acidimicrobiales bacterium]|nr:acyl-CoA synthetase [Acidimicrobiales bacterium]